MSTAVIPIDQPNPVAELEQQALTWQERARAVQIATPEAHVTACGFLLAIKELRKKAEEHHRPVIDAAHKAHQQALAALKRIDGPLAEAEGIIKPKISGYETEQKRIGEENRRKHEEEARRQQEELIEAAAQQAEEQGASPEEVQAIIEQPVIVPPPVSAPTFQPVSGVSTSVNWKAEVTDLRALCRAIAEGKAAPTLVLPNSTALNGMARALKQSLNVPGCRAVAESIVRAGRR